MPKTRTAFMLNQIDTETAMAWVPNGPDSESDRLVPCSLLPRRPDVNLPIRGWAMGSPVGTWCGRGEHARKCPHRTGQVPGPGGSPSWLGAMWVMQVQEARASREHRVLATGRGTPRGGPLVAVLGAHWQGAEGPQRSLGPARNDQASSRPADHQASRLGGGETQPMPGSPAMDSRTFHGAPPLRADPNCKGYS